MCSPSTGSESARQPPASPIPTDAKLERERAREAERAWRSQRDDLQHELEAARLQHAEALLKQREDAAAQVRGAQRALADAEEEVERTRRELSAGFLLQKQELEQRWRGQVRRSPWGRHAAL